MNLSKNENLLQEWKYAEYRTGGFTTVETLSVTNERVIIESNGKRGVNKTELLLDSINGWHVKNERPNLMWAYLFMILGALPLLYSIFEKVTAKPDFFGNTPALNMELFIAGLALVIFGAVLYKLLHRKVSFAIVFHFNASSMAGFNANSIKFGFFSAGNKTKVKVNKTSINEIVSSIGTLIIENRK